MKTLDFKCYHTHATNKKFNSFDGVSGGIGGEPLFKNFLLISIGRHMKNLTLGVKEKGREEGERGRGGECEGEEGGVCGDLNNLGRNKTG